MLFYICEDIRLKNCPEVNEMSKRVLWDKYETAILIDAYVRVKNNELTEKDAKKEVSSLLRLRAINSGLEIDEKFRNINGISIQFNIIRGLMEGYPSNMHGPVNLFSDMVNLYKDNPVAFNMILVQAKQECDFPVNIQG